MQQHPELIELQALAAGILDPARQRAVDEHLGGCSECAKTYVEVFLGRSGGGPKGATAQQPAAAAPTPVRPATPIASPPTRATPQPAFVVDAAPAAPVPVAASARPVSPSPTRVETVVTLRSGEQPTVELHEVPDPSAGRYGASAVSQVASASLGQAVPLLDLENPTPVAATAAESSDAIAEALQQQPTLTEAITRLRSSGMSHIARALTPPFVQPAVPASAGSVAPPPSAGPNRMMLAIAAGAALLVGGGAVAYKGMVNAAREAAVAAARAPVAAPVAATSAASTPPATPTTGTPTTPTGDAATTTTSGGTIAVAPPAPTREATPREPAARETKAKKTESQQVAEKPARRESAPALPSVSLPDVSGAVSDDATIDRLSGRSASRAAATDLQRSAGWATSRTTAKP